MLLLVKDNLGWPKLKTCRTHHKLLCTKILHGASIILAICLFQPHPHYFFSHKKSNPLYRLFSELNIARAHLSI